MKKAKTNCSVVSKLSLAMLTVEDFQNIEATPKRTLKAGYFSNLAREAQFSNVIILL